MKMPSAITEAARYNQKAGQNGSSDQGFMRAAKYGRRIKIAKSLLQPMLLRSIACIAFAE
jgi:hypothetical protein